MDTRRIIIGAFRDLLCRNSVGNISVSMIIDAAGVSKPTFYRYFYSKYELVNVVFQEMLAPFSALAEGETWKNALESTLASLERNAAIMKNGFRTAEEFSLREICMRQIIEPHAVEMLRKKGVDVGGRMEFFAIRAMMIVHVAAMIGWACDSERSEKAVVIEQLKGAIPTLLIKEMV